MSAVAEEWRALPGFEGWVDISTHSRARRWYRSQAARKPPVRLDEPEVVAPRAAPGGYAYFTVRNAHCAGRPLALHKAVLLTFVGPAPSGWLACHFPDPDTSNCCLDNLRWDVRAENWEDARCHHSGDAERVAARLAELRERFPYLRPTVEGITFSALGHSWPGDGNWSAPYAARARGAA